MAAEAFDNGNCPIVIAGKSKSLLTQRSFARAPSETERLIDRVAGWRDEDSSIAFSSDHLQGLNDGIGRFVLVARLVLDLLGALGNLQNQLIAVGLLIQKLVKNSSRAHFKLPLASFSSGGSLYGISQHTRCAPNC